MTLNSVMAVILCYSEYVNFLKLS